MIRIPIHYQEKQYQLYQTKEKLIKELHREPTLKEISSDTGISEKLLKEYEAQQGIRIVGSLDAPINLEKEESETFGDFIADTDQNIEEMKIKCYPARHIDEEIEEPMNMETVVKAVAIDSMNGNLILLAEVED